ncbi:S1 RNA-binding domain-containing protein, partial [Patescibacteria group bacterium]
MKKKSIKKGKSKKGVKVVKTPKKLKKTKKTTKTSVKAKKQAQVVKKKVVKKNPQTMEELLQATGYSFKGLKRGRFVDGIITDISKKLVLVDIGAKTEGIILSSDFEEAADYILNLKVGDKIKAIVSSPENDKGQILLS